MSLLSDHLINPDKIIAEYVWIGGSSLELRSKASTMSGPVCDPSYSTNQAPGNDIEVLLYPQAIFKDPFSISAMCDTYYTPAREPIPTNMKKKKKNKNKKKKKKRSRTRY